MCTWSSDNSYQLYMRLRVHMCECVYMCVSLSLWWGWNPLNLFCEFDLYTTTSDQAPFVCFCNSKPGLGKRHRNKMLTDNTIIYNISLLTINLQQQCLCLLLQAKFKPGYICRYKHKDHKIYSRSHIDIEWLKILFSWC